MRRLLLAGAFLMAAWAASSLAAPNAQGCAFSVAPTAYEPPRDRSVHLLGLELAGYNMLFPDDTFFGTPTVETGLRGARTTVDDPYAPPLLLKATGWIESGMSQADGNTPFAAVGPALISFDCGHGIMQITSGMTSPQDGRWPSSRQSLVGTHYLYNIGRGAAILVDKWNGAPEVRPIAGTDTDSDPTIVENWYFAVWGYNGFTGPGANRSNHPMDPDYAWPRTGFSCGPADDGFGHRYGNYPYQELVFGCASRPPSVDGAQLWTAPSVPLALPDLSNPEWSEPLSLANFVSPYRDMDMPTPRPWHNDQTPQPGDGVPSFLLGSPILRVSHTSVDQLVNEVTISNIGSGILAWRVKHQQDWIAVDKQAGVALSRDVPCAEESPCQRSATLTITVAPEQAPSPNAPAWVEIESLTTGEVRYVWVAQGNPGPLPIAGDVDCRGNANAIDAALILQFVASLVDSLRCPANADVNQDGAINPIDAALILQFEAGIIGGLPP